MEDDLSFLGKWKTTSVFKANGRKSKFPGKLKTTLFMGQMEDSLNYSDKWKTTLVIQANARLPQILG